LASQQLWRVFIRRSHQRRSRALLKDLVASGIRFATGEEAAAAARRFEQ
jgi:hypothetical protein